MTGVLWKPAEKKGNAMHLYSRKCSHTNAIVTVLVFCAMFFLFWMGFSHAAETNSAQELQVTQSAVRRAVVNCYAIEGSYPPDVKYLENHYGIVIDHSKYLVRYELAGSNVMPTVEVLRKGSE